MCFPYIIPGMFLRDISSLKEALAACWGILSLSVPVTRLSGGDSDGNRWPYTVSEKGSIVPSQESSRGTRIIITVCVTKPLMILINI